MGPTAGLSHPVRCPCRACLCAYSPRQMSPGRSRDKQERSTNGGCPSAAASPGRGAICQPLEPWKPREGTLFCPRSHCPCFLATLPSSFSTFLAAPGPHSFVSPVSEVCWEDISQMVTVPFYHMGPRDRTLMSSSEASTFPRRAISLADLETISLALGEKVRDQVAD